VVSKAGGFGPVDILTQLKNVLGGYAE